VFFASIFDMLNGVMTLNLSRRGWLMATAAAASQAPAQNRKIRTGILGIQHSHLAGKLQAMFDHGAYDVTSVAEPDPAVKKAKASLPQLAQLRWTTVDALLADPALDLIVFEGTVQDAIPLGKRVIEAGKHLHLEKPPSNKIEPFRDLVETAKRQRKLLQLGYLYRFHAGVDAALEAHRQGWLGEIQMIRATMNSDRAADQRAVEARYPGGSMFELGGHMVDRIIAFLGRPTKVNHWLRHDTKVNDTLKDNTLAVFEYPGALATLASSAKMSGAEGHRSFEVIGTDGTFLIQPMEPHPIMKVHLRNAAGPYKKGWQEVRPPEQPRYVADFQELARAVQSGTALKYSYDHEFLLQETLLRASGEIA